MQQGQYTNIRFESMNKDNMLKEIKHDLRTIKIKSVINNNNNFLYIDNKNYGNFSDDKKRNKEKSEQFNEDFLNKIEKDYKKIYFKNKKRSVDLKRNNSFNMGILTFSDSILKIDRKIIIENGIKTIENMCKELKTKLHYVSFHFDEKGLPHAHFFTNNFDENGNSLSATRNKGLGEKLQDLGNIYFKDLGFSRGISKSITNRNHLTIKEFQEYEDQKIEIEKIKAENKDLKKENDLFKIENKDLKKENDLLLLAQEKSLERLKETLKTFNELQLNYKNKSTDEIMKLAERYWRNGQSEKIEGMVNNLEKLIIKVDKTYLEKRKKQYKAQETENYFNNENIQKTQNNQHKGV